MSKGSAAKGGSRRCVVWAALLYTVVLAWGTRTHTFWRDETEAWIVARDSHGLHSLLHNIRYEGHPAGWYVVLYGITRFTANPEWMKLPNFLFAVAAAVMILSARHVALYVRLGLIFSYFLLFEYGVIDRNYMMGIMLLLAALLLMKSGKGVFRVPVALSLAALTSLPALIIAVCFYPLHLLPVICNGERRRIRDWWRALGLYRVVAAVLFAVCALASVAEIWPPADSGLLLDSAPRKGLAVTLFHPFHDLAKGYLPMPALRVAFWDTTLIGALPLTLLGIALAVGLFFFFRRRAVRIFFASATVLLLMEMMVSRRTEARHVGWLFVVFVLALLLEEVAWLRDAEPVNAEPVNARGSLWRPLLLYGVLSVQVAAGVFAIVMSAEHMFSGSKEAALFLRDQGLEGQPMVFAPDYVGLTVLAYLQRPSAYYVERHGLGSIVVWDKQEFYGRAMPSRNEFLAASQNGRSPVLITEEPLTKEQMSNLRVKQLAVFSGEINPDRYFIYR